MTRGIFSFLRMVPLSQNCSFCEHCFWHNLKTNKVKYIKVYIPRKGISRGIYFCSQIYRIFENRQKIDFLADFFFFFNKGKQIFLDKNHSFD